MALGKTTTSLDEEGSALIVLETNLEKFASLTEDITRGFDKLSKSAQAVEESIRPIYDTSQSLTAIAENVTTVIADIEGTQGHVEAFLREKSLLDSKPDIHHPFTYIASLTRLDTITKALETSAFSQSQSICQMSSQIFSRACSRLQEAFVALLVEISEPIDAAVYLTEERSFKNIDATSVSLVGSYMEFFEHLGSEEEAEAAFKSFSDIRRRYINQSVLALSKTVDGYMQRPSKMIYKRGANAIAHYSDALAFLLLAESSLARSAIKTKEKQVALMKRIFSPALREYVSNNSP